MPARPRSNPVACRLSCKIPPMFPGASPTETSSPSQSFVANRALYRTAVQSHDRLFTLAFVALYLWWLAAGGTTRMSGPSENRF
jgi:hypothetical protein